MDKELLQQLARRGAEIRMAELLEEVVMLEKLVQGEAKVSTVPKESQTANDTPPRRKRHLSAAARLAVSKRMKAYWAAQRREK